MVNPTTRKGLWHSKNIGKAEFWADEVEFCSNSHQSTIMAAARLSKGRNLTRFWKKCGDPT